MSGLALHPYAILLSTVEEIFDLSKGADALQTAALEVANLSLLPAQGCIRDG